MKRRNEAHIVAVNMGYGHERPARTLQFLSSEDVVLANDYKGIPHSDKVLWEEGRKLYEKISRFKKVPLVGPAVFGVMDNMQAIDDFYPRRDLSKPNFQLRQFYFFIRSKHFMKHLVDKLAEDPKPLICTFMTPAFAAEEFGYPEDIYVLATDADISRTWAPLDAKRTRITYLAPNGRVVERLKLYGVPEKQIALTGFPLPLGSATKGKQDPVLNALKRRICNLDPHGRFMNHAKEMLEASMGKSYCAGIKRKKTSPLRVAFAVGGAGAQKEIGITIAKSLSRDLARGRVVLDLVAGARPEVAKYFRDELLRHRMGNLLKNGALNIVYSSDRPTYFEAFAKLIHEVDVLWTKPSELSFYAGLGLPIIMSPTVGSQEDYNRKWLGQVGAGMDQYDPRYTSEWLFDWVESGALARMAWHGYTEAPTRGSIRISDILQGKPNSIHELPLVV